MDTVSPLLGLTCQWLKTHVRKANTEAQFLVMLSTLEKMKQGFGVTGEVAAVVSV